MTDERKAALSAHSKLEKHEKHWRGRNWGRFSLTKRGRLSWADWFTMKVRP